MERVIKQFVFIVVVLVCAGFFIYLIFGRDENGNYSLFKDLPTVINQMQSEDSINKTAPLVNAETVSGAPQLKYSKGAQHRGNSPVFKSLFEVTVDGHTFAGDTGTGFALYLKDIRDAAGNSRLVSLSTEAIESSDEIIADFVYDYEKDILHIHGSGIYTVYVKAYGSNGSSALYEFKLPVEEGGST